MMKEQLRLLFLLPMYWLSQPLSLTLFDNSPSREPFGVLPLTKSCPRWRGKWHEVPKGVRLKTAECRELFPLSFAYAQQLPRKRWRLLVQCKLKPKACPERGFEPSAPSGRCSEGRIGRNREYCKRQRSKTTIFQPAFVAANVMSSRKGNNSKQPTAASYSPSVTAYAATPSP